MRSITHSNDAVRDYVKAVEGNVPDDVMRDAAAAIGDDPGFTPAYRLLAESKTMQHDPAAALALLDEAAQRAVSPIERARVHLQSAGLRNDPAGRRAALAELAQADPGNPEQWHALADAQYSAHAYTEAAAALRQQLALEPDNRNTLNQLGYASANAGDFPAALEALRRYQAAAPEDPNVSDSLGDIHLTAGRLREAEQFYLRANQKDPRFMDGADLFKASMARLMTGDIPGSDGNPRALRKVPGGESRWRGGYRTHRVDLDHGRPQGGVPADARDCPLRRELVRGMRPRRAAMPNWPCGICSWETAPPPRDVKKPSACRGANVGHRRGGAVSGATAGPGRRMGRARREAVSQSRLAPIRDLALAGALLLDREYQPASEILRKLYGEGARTSVDEGIPVMLAWSLIETGRYQEAAPFLRANPVPPPTGPNVFATFYFPRIYYLRGLLAEKNGKPQEAREAYKLFLQLSGPDALAWGEEGKAKGH